MAAGLAVLPERLIRTVECLAQSLFISPPTLSQLAALAAFDARAELDAKVALYRRNRDILIRRLPEAGIERFLPPEGAFYLYADVSNISNDSETLCLRLLAETGVALTPGMDFDRSRGHSTVRISFAGPEAVISEALERLIAWRSREPSGASAQRGSTPSPVATSHADAAGLERVPAPPP